MILQEMKAKIPTKIAFLQMFLFHNLGVKLRGCLCDVPWYASEPLLALRNLVENCLFLDRKLTRVPIQRKNEFIDGHELE